MNHTILVGKTDKTKRIKKIRNAALLYNLLKNEAVALLGARPRCMEGNGTQRERAFPPAANLAQPLLICTVVTAQACGLVKAHRPLFTCNLRNQSTFLSLSFFLNLIEQVKQ